MQRMLKKMAPKILTFASAMIVLATYAHAATITGTVKGPDGAPFKGAFVQAQNTKTKITVNVLSHKDGGYRVEDLPAGEYVLRIRAVGYQADARTGVTLTASQSASMDWALKTGTALARSFPLSRRKVDTEYSRQGDGFRSHVQLPRRALPNLSRLSIPDGFRLARCRGREGPRGLHANQDALPPGQHGER